MDFGDLFAEINPLKGMSASIKGPWNTVDIMRLAEPIGKPFSVAYPSLLFSYASWQIFMIIYFRGDRCDLRDAIDG